jgi:ABC-type sugar transport system permease subunit
MKVSLNTLNKKLGIFFHKSPQDPHGGGKKRSSMNGFKLSSAIFVWVMLFLPIAYLFICDIGVKLSSFAMPFRNYQTGEWTFENFERVWWAITSPSAGDESLLVAFKNTLMYFSWNIIQIPVSLFLTYFLFKRIRGKKLFVIIYNIPSMVASVVLVTAFKELTSMHGILGSIMEALGRPLTDSIYKTASTANAAILSYCILFGLCGGIMYVLCRH